LQGCGSRWSRQQNAKPVASPFPCKRPRDALLVMQVRRTGCGSWPSCGLGGAVGVGPVRARFQRDSWPLAVVHPLLACPNRHPSGVVCQLADSADSADLHLLAPCAIVSRLARQ
jgi:hypothetical protein